MKSRRWAWTVFPASPFVRALGLAVAMGGLLAACAAGPAPLPIDRGMDDDDVEARIARVASGLLTYNVVRGEAAGLELLERMDEYNVPAVSVAVVEDGRIAWARAWGVVAAGSDVAADTATLFQAASISKPVAATAALRLVERGALSLDDDIDTWLTSWRVPANDFTEAQPVTLRRLLSHTAGTTVSGFPGYAAGTPVPTTVQVLDGAFPANTRAVVVDTLPGSGFHYSGGGYTIAQQAMVDASGRAFPELMRELVLAPAGMRHSTFEQPLPTTRVMNAAVAHGRDGAPMPGRHHTYPEMAAAGLWTTPSDLARFGLAIARAYRGEDGGLLPSASARAMLTPVDADYGLGFGVEAADGALWFTHGGSNEGFQAWFSMLTDGRGAVIMTNGDNGYPLAIELMRAIAVEYDLPGFRTNVRDAVDVDAATLAGIAGEYAGSARGRDVVLELSARPPALLATVRAFGWFERTLRPSAPDTFFFLTGPGELTVERDAAGDVVAIVATGFGDPIRLVRR